MKLAIIDLDKVNKLYQGYQKEAKDLGNDIGTRRDYTYLATGIREVLDLSKPLTTELLEQYGKTNL